MINSLPSNPLPASLQINLRDPNDYLDVATYLHGQPAVDRVLNIKQDGRPDGHGHRRPSSRRGRPPVVVGLIVLFIIVNTIRLAVVARADEIEIMRLVGASDAFIRWPFIFEGAFVGLLGALITIGLLFVGQGPITSLLSRLLQRSAGRGQRHRRPERGAHRAGHRASASASSAPMCPFAAT